MPSELRKRPMDAVPWLKARTHRRKSPQPSWTEWAAGITSFGVVGGFSLIVVRIVVVLIG